MPEISKIDFYRREERFDTEKSRINDWCKTDGNKNQIHKLLRWADARDLSYARRLKYLLFLKYMVKWLEVDLDKVSKDDIIYLIGHVNKAKNFSYETKKEFKSALKKFFDVTLYDDNKELVDWMYDRRNDIFKNKSNDDVRNDKDKFTKEEMSQLIEVSDTRMKAYLIALFESCCRPSEILSCKIKDLEPTEYGFMLKIPQSKTKVRNIPLFDSAPYLKDWLKIHPNNKHDSFLFCTHAYNNHGGRWSPNGAIQHLKKVALKAGIEKNITNYALRRSGFTYKSCVKKISNSSMELIMGWSKGAFSKRAKAYDLNTEENAQNEIKLAYGKLTGEKKLDLPMKTCLKCSEENGFTEKYCRRCSFPLDEKDIAKIQMKQMAYEELWDELISAVDYTKLGKRAANKSKRVMELLNS